MVGSQSSLWVVPELSHCNVTTGSARVLGLDFGGGLSEQPMGCA